MATEKADEIDNFKPVFKKYKRRDRKLDLLDVIDIRQLKDTLFYNQSNLERVDPKVPSTFPLVGILPAQQWHIFHFLQHPGFYLIRNPFVAGYQQYWVSRCLQDLPQPPNVTNLRVHPDVDPSTVWAQHEANCQAGKPFDNTCQLRKLRWTTIGYHYNWDTKEYREEARSPFPIDLGVLAQYVAQVMGFDLQPEAGIINYYHLDSTLAAHTDHSELDHQAPLISISFGQDAVFLIGGQTKTIPPTPVRLCSGDICVMSGGSRLAYHAVPRILPPTSPYLPSCFDTARQDLQPSLCIQSGQKSESIALSSADTFPETTVDKDGKDQGGLTAGDKTAAVKYIWCDEKPGDMTMTKRDMCCDRKQPGCHATAKMTSDVCCERIEDGSAQMKEKKSKLSDNIQKQAETSDDSKDIDVVDYEQNQSSFTCGASATSVVTEHQARDEDNDCCVCHLDSRDKLDLNDPTTEMRWRDRRKNPSPAQDVEGKSCQQKTVVQANSQIVSRVNEEITETLSTLKWQPFAIYLKSSRINVNIRQVLKPGQTSLSANTTSQSPLAYI